MFLQYVMWQVADHTVDLPLIVQQGERRGSFLTGIGPDHHRAQAVDSAESQLVRVFFPEEVGEPDLHILGGRHGVGHGENPLRADALVIEHVPQPGHQHGGLAAPRNSQQQDRTLRLTDGLLLLPVQPDGVLAFEFFVGHERLLHILSQSF